MEQRVWREIIGALPGHWGDRAAQQALRRAVAQAAVCERMEERLRLLRKVDDDRDEDYDAIVTSHGAAAKKQGMTPEMLGELMAIVGMANETNSLANGYRVPVDARFENLF